MRYFATVFCVYLVFFPCSIQMQVSERSGGVGEVSRMWCFHVFHKQHLSSKSVTRGLQVESLRMRGNGLRLHERRLTLDIRKNFCAENVVRYWNRLSRVVVSHHP